MNIINIRLGQATNSSSLHSFIETKDAKNIKDYDCNKSEFGWNFFTAASVSAKTQYLTVVLEQNLSEKLSREMSKIVIQALLKRKPTGGYIDHQSMPDLPSSWNGRDLNLDFWEDFKNFVLREDIIIIGGNDNSGRRHHLFDKNKKVSLPFIGLEYQKFLVGRRDKDYWVLFNRDTGAKIRFSFTTKEPYIKASAPELVDMKITDYCPNNCSFCYMDSTREGKAATYNDIYITLRALEKAHVFEVAIGGGEPTTHPNFSTILWEAREYGVVPNFSTKSLDWFDNKKITDAVRKYCGGFAYSTTNKLQIDELVFNLKAHDLPKEKASIQYVMGVSSLYSFKDILEACSYHRLPLTLLGYKNVGRGCNRKPTDYSGWLKIVTEFKKDNWLRLGIDTILASQTEKELIDDGIPKEMYDTKEGKFSCFIDCVNKTMARCSYEPNEIYTFDPDTWIKTFRTF